MVAAVTVTTAPHKVVVLVALVATAKAHYLSRPVVTPLLLAAAAASTTITTVIKVVLPPLVPSVQLVGATDTRAPTAAVTPAVAVVLVVVVAARAVVEAARVGREPAVVLQVPPEVEAVVEVQRLVVVMGPVGRATLVEVPAVAAERLRLMDLALYEQAVGAAAATAIQPTPVRP